MFDLSDTLAFVELTADGEQIATFEVYSGAVEVLRALEAKGVPCGIVFDCVQIPEDHVRNRLLSTELREFADRLVVVPRDAKARYAFEAASSLVGRDQGYAESPVLFVCTDATDRERASHEGFKTAPHPALAYGVLFGGGSLQYLRVRMPTWRDRGEWMAVLRDQPLVPIHVAAEPGNGGSTSIYVIADTRTAAALDHLGFWVDRLGAPGDPATTSAYLFRDVSHKNRGLATPPSAAPYVFASGPAASGVLASTGQGILVALSSDAPVQSFAPIGGRTAHALALLPSVNCLREGAAVADRANTLCDAATADPLSCQEEEILRGHFDSGFMSSVVKRYAIVGRDETGGTYGSRNVKHPGNEIAVDLLASDLKQIASGRLTVKRHCFPHQGKNATNVVAVLNSSAERDLEGIVLVCAHLDSVNECGSPNTVSAPGANDDASGMAGVLGAAKAFVELASLGRQHREIHFILFNCEEDGRTGSQTYAYALAACGIRVAAMYEMDMIGYDHKGVGIVQAHAGFDQGEVSNGAAVKARSGDQARLIKHLRPIVTCLTEEAQIFTSPSECGSGRTDHSRFHAAGYPGCWVSENVFKCGDGCDVLYPEYHTADDTTINAVYASQIARLVAAAAWIAATR
jgi:hypothetical protein